MLRACERLHIDPLRFLQEYPRHLQSWVLAFSSFRGREEHHIAEHHRKEMEERLGR